MDTPWRQYSIGDLVKFDEVYRRNLTGRRAEWICIPTDLQYGVYIGYRTRSSGLVNPNTYDQQGWLEVESTVQVALVVVHPRKAPVAVPFEAMARIFGKGGKRESASGNQ